MEIIDIVNKNNEVIGKASYNEIYEKLLICMYLTNLIYKNQKLLRRVS